MKNGHFPSGLTYSTWLLSNILYRWSFKPFFRNKCHMGRLEKQVMFSLSQTSATLTPALRGKWDWTHAISSSFPPPVLLHGGLVCGGGWPWHDTASLWKTCSQLHPSKGLTISRLGKNFQASEISWDSTARRKSYVFWGVPKERRSSDCHGKERNVCPGQHFLH